jgi:hypothetical protein
MAIRVNYLFFEQAFYQVDSLMGLNMKIGWAAIYLGNRNDSLKKQSEK